MTQIRFISACALSAIISASLPGLARAQDGTAPPPAGQSENAAVDQTAQADEIVVVAEAQDSGIDGVLYRVPDSDELPTLNAAEVLRQVPFVTVDQDGNVQLLGRSGVTIIIDGQEIRNAREILQGLRGDQLDSINVVTNPSARFPGGSRSGVIELTLRKAEGLRRVTLNESVDTLGTIRLSASPTLEFGDVSITGTLSLAEIRQEFTSATERPFFNAASGVERQDRESVVRSGFANGTIKYAPTAALTVSMGITAGQSDSQSDEAGAISIGPDADAIVSAESHVSEFNYLTLTPNVSYEHANGDVWTVKFNRSREEVDTQIARQIESADAFSSQRRERRAEDGANLDFQGRQNAGRRLRFGAGYERSQRNERNITTGVTIDGFDTSFAGAISEYSLYSDFQFSIDSLRILPGIRAEYRQYPTTETEVDFLRLFPSLHLERRFERGRMLRASYSRRVSWPGIRDVNSALQFSDGITAYVGNPDLRPSSQDTFELSYTKASGRDQRGATLYATRERDQFISLSTIIDEILITSAANGGSETSLGGSMFLREGITDDIRLDASVNGARITQRLPTLADFEPDPEFRYTARLQLEYAEDSSANPKTDTLRAALLYRNARQSGLVIFDESFSLEGSWTHRFSDKISGTLSVSGINLPREQVTTYITDAGRFSRTFRDQGLLVQFSLTTTID